mmetsp:Transcript_20647/g.30546  ORF Transcript_20647/g.30546 Transcript_20647/m.30546 type:complete len:313 (+) Transcript_20647:86-1024(+)
MDEQRALLDQLMGKERNVPLNERTNRRRHFSDSDVCKFHLVGLCPYALFSNTKSELGGHPNGEEDDDRMKAMYEELPEEEREKYRYDRKLYNFLEDLVAGVDRKVERNRERCALENRANGLPEESLQRLIEIEATTKEKTEQAEKLANDGEIDDAQTLLEEVDVLNAEKQEIEKEFTSIKTVKRNIVCEVSGNIMSSADNEERIMCHFQGKQYLGWKACREKLKELKEKIESRENSASSRLKALENPVSRREVNASIEKGYDDRSERHRDHKEWPGRRSSSRDRYRRRRSCSRSRSRRSKTSNRSRSRDRKR